MAKPYVLLTLEYPPQVGGVANYYANLVRADERQCLDVIANEHGQLTHPWLKIFAVLWQRQRHEPIRKIIVGQVLPVGTVVWIWRMFFGTPYIVYTHGMDITVPQRFVRKRWLLRHILQSAEAVVTVSQFSANRLVEFLPTVKTKLTIISPAPNITPERFPDVVQPQSSTQPTPFLLSVGRLVKRKGFAEAIEAFAQLAAEHHDWKYYIVGGGPERVALERLIAQHQLEHRVQLLGQLSDGATARLYAKSSFFVLPAQQLADGDFEGYGTVIVEANSFAKPAIATRTGGVADAVQDGVTGVLVPPNDEIALTRAMTLFCDKPELTVRLGQAAQTWAKQRTWSKNFKQLFALLER